MSEEKKKTLKRTFGMREAVTITVGTVVGVGLFTTGANVVGDLGPAVILATLVAMLISIYPSLLYAEMGAALPYAGGTYQYASLGIGKPFGMLAGWNFIISLVSVTSGEALAFSFYFKTFFSALGIELPVSDTVVATLIVLVFIVTNVRGIEMTGKLQNGFMFFFWGVAIIWFLMMLPNVNMPNFVQMPDFIAKSTPLSFIASVSMIWWCFAGFETCCAMGEEIKYPQINIPRALILAPFIVFAVNSAFQWFLVGIVPISEISSLATASAPFAEAMKTAGILGFPLVLLAAGIAFGGDFSTLNASIAVPPRYLFTMSRDGAMPIEVETGIEFEPKAENETAGVILYQNHENHLKFEIKQVEGKKVFEVNSYIHGEETKLSIVDISKWQGILKIMIQCHDQEARVWIGKEKNLKPVAEKIPLTAYTTEEAGGFVGCTVGMYASSNGKQSENYADFGWFYLKNMD